MQHTRNPRARVALVMAVVAFVASFAIGTSAPATADATPPILQNDCGTGGDAGSNEQAATPLVVPQTNCTGDIFVALDGADWYTFDLAGGTSVSVTMTPTAGVDLNLCLHAPDGDERCSRRVGNGVGESVSDWTNTPGTWKVEVESFGLGSDAYTMSVAATAAPSDCSTGVDAGGSHATATLITLPATNCTAVLGSSGDTEDWYQFTVTSGQVITATMTPSSNGANYNICLYDPSGTQLNCSTNSGTGATDTVVRTAGVAGNWRLQVFVVSGTGLYTMSVSAVTPPNDCGTGVDAGGSHATATLITLPKTNCTGALGSSGDSEDWYQFTVTAGQVLTVSMTPNANADYDVCFHNPTDSSSSCSVNPGAGATENRTYTATVSGNWRLRVYVRWGSGSYTMSVSTVTPQNDCGTGGDAGGSHATATPITLPKNCNAKFVAPGDTEDWYRFPVTSGDFIHVIVDPEEVGANFDICLHDPNGVQYQCSNQAGTSAENIDRVANVSGDWRLRVYVVAGSGLYPMVVSTS